MSDVIDFFTKEKTTVTEQEIIEANVKQKEQDLAQFILDRPEYKAHVTALELELLTIDPKDRIVFLAARMNVALNLLNKAMKTLKDEIK